jgi:hypothetical protein
VLEQIFGRRRRAALEDEARFDEAAQRLLQVGLCDRRGRCQSRRPSSEACKVAGTASDDRVTADIDA